MELKQMDEPVVNELRSHFNRTNMELKLRMALLWVDFSDDFNRTNMELKPLSGRGSLLRRKKF